MMKRTTILKLIILSFAMVGIANAQMPDFTRLDDCRITADEGNSQGSSLADFDNDGDIDLLIGNTSGFGPRKPVLLYKNERGGHFSRILTGDLATENQDGMPTASFVDIDNDGDWDVSTPCVFYMNDGYGDFTQEFMPGVGAACGNQITSWVDIDNDGDLDCSIWSQMQTPNQLYINNGDGTFIAVEEGPFVLNPLSTEALFWADTDNDGDMDVFAANFSFTSLGSAVNKNTSYVNAGGTLNLLDAANTLVQHDQGSLGASWGDYDNDGDLDLFLVTVRDENFLYRNDGEGNYTELSIDPPEAVDKCFLGSAWGDFDNDGDLDLFVTSEQNDIDFVEDVDVAHFNMLFQNNGDGSFTELATGNLKDDGGHSCTLLDHDNDGDLDILVPNGSLGEPLINYIYSNNGNSNHWININCRGRMSNASAIGARIWAKTEINGQQVSQMRELGQQTGLHSISSPRFHFGLGDAEQVDTLIIRWPSGQIDTCFDVKANQFYRAIEDSVLELDLSASNYIEYVPAIETLELYSRSETTIDLDDHFSLETGDSVPEGAGEVINYLLFEDEDTDLLTSELDGSLLTLNAGNSTGSATVRLQASADQFVTRIDEILVEVSENTGVDNSIADKPITIFPNPAGDRLNVEFSEKLSGPVGIRIFDLSGKFCLTMILEGASLGTQSLDIAELESGIYLIRISGKAFLHEEKLLKME